MLSRQTIVFSSQKKNLRRIIAIALTVMGIVVGAFALHSIAGSHSNSIHPAADATQLPVVQEASFFPAATATVSIVGWADRTLTQANPDWDPSAGCAILIAVCGVLAVLVALVFVTRWPSLTYRLKASGRHLTELILDAQSHASAPSLTLLSISRI